VLGWYLYEPFRIQISVTSADTCNSPCPLHLQCNIVQPQCAFFVDTDERWFDRLGTWYTSAILVVAVTILATIVYYRREFT